MSISRCSSARSRDKFLQLKTDSLDVMRGDAQSKLGLAPFCRLDAKLYLVCSAESSYDTLFSAGAEFDSSVVPCRRGLLLTRHFTFDLLISTHAVLRSSAATSTWEKKRCFLDVALLNNIKSIIA